MKKLKKEEVHNQKATNYFFGNQIKKNKNLIFWQGSTKRVQS